MEASLMRTESSSGFSHKSLLAEFENSYSKVSLKHSRHAFIPIDEGSVTYRKFSELPNIVPKACFYAFVVLSIFYFMLVVIVGYIAIIFNGSNSVVPEKPNQVALISQRLMDPMGIVYECLESQSDDDRSWNMPCKWMFAEFSNHARTERLKLGFMSSGKFGLYVDR
jgi:hypothetical protein